MFVVLCSFLLGITSGLRALTGLAVLSWAARLGYLPLESTWLAFLGYAFTPYILSVMAIGELVNDKLPKTPSRLIPSQFITRVVTGTLCAVAIELSTNQWLIGLPAGVVGSVAGTLGGARVRGFAAARFGRDLPVALLEDAAAIGIAVLAVSLLR
jgi:uncharacterized membrane protein